MNRSPQREHPDHEVAIVGAGISGIGAAIALQQAGIHNVAIFERASDIGGTWRDNTYPGVGVDVPAQGYQFSYHLKPDWSRVFAKGAEVKSYVDGCADHYNVRRLVRFCSEVTARKWDEKQHFWRLTIAGEEVTARFVISAIGPFVEPKPAEIVGVKEFRGTTLHSTAWDHSVDLAGKRVAIIGTGASAVQIIPEIAPAVARLDVYQRTPIWVAPKPDLAMSNVVSEVFRRAPSIQRRVRSGSVRTMEAFLMGLALKHERLGPLNRLGTRLLRNVWYRVQVRDPETRRKLTPNYDFGCKRPATSNSYLRAFNRSNVKLVTDPIARITPGGIETVQGVQREIDVLILATGFRTATDPECYREKPVRGRGGFDLATYYAEHRARSYESVSMPGLPNHFIVFGPYGWVGGTWHDLVETATNHITRVIREAQGRGATAVEVKEAAADRWTAFALSRMSRSLWALGNCSSANSYYYDHHGDTTFVRPTSAQEARIASRSFPLEDYEFRSLEADDEGQDLLSADSDDQTRPRRVDVH
ncbi:monooxygenase [Mycobacteroides chelonae]|uniref:flavin-containing monooxygenase n=1 Tax=Mycobacteroides chelonae TaxID=1774 RepID=UPI0008A9A33B|nr:NAD(P)/FAD-dependent oxidoreductase [Mycobacteroides chelonae]OHU55733.1 monooxygenase [Mycobacteroides chelonae]PKQ58262.1 monooxygenase [Mycobacterium sp. MHSD3]